MISSKMAFGTTIRIGVQDQTVVLTMVDMLFSKEMSFVTFAGEPGEWSQLWPCWPKIIKRANYKYMLGVNGG